MVRNVLVLLACLALGAGLGAAPADAARKQKAVNPNAGLEPMKVLIVRDGRPGCEPTCTEWIAAQGDIVQGTAAEFRRVLKAMGKRRLPVLINSRGGSVEAAMEVGRLIRDRKLDVGVARSDLEPCTPGLKACKKGKPTDGIRANTMNGRAICASSCPLVLAGGVRRVVPPDAYVGVHQIRAFQTLTRVKRLYRVFSRIVDGQPREVSRKLVKESKVSERTVERTVTERDYKPIRKYLKSQGIAESLVVLMLSSPNAAMRWLTADEMRVIGLSTERKTADVLLSPPTAALSAPAGAETANAAPVVPALEN